MLFVCEEWSIDDNDVNGVFWHLTSSALDRNKDLATQQISIEKLGSLPGSDLVSCVLSSGVYNSTEHFPLLFLSDLWEPSVTCKVCTSVLLTISSKSQALATLISGRPAPLLPSSSMVIADLHPGQSRTLHSLPHFQFASLFSEWSR